MQSVKFMVGAVLSAALLLGCSESGTGYEANPAGADAKSGKAYTTEDAASAQPKRGGSEGAGEAAGDK